MKESAPLELVTGISAFPPLKLATIYRSNASAPEKYLVSLLCYSATVSPAEVTHPKLSNLI